LKEDISEIIQGCLRGKREHQVQLYKQMYGYAMSIALRYSKYSEEAEEIVNDAFMKVFTKLNQYDAAQSFKTWFRRILINTSIDYYRRSEKHYNHLNIVEAYDVSVDDKVISALSEEEIVKLVQELPPAYRMVFNLSVMEGFAHQEIAEKLGITESTSRSNLMKARAKLQAMMVRFHGQKFQNYG